MLPKGALSYLSVLSILISTHVAGCYGRRPPLQVGPATRQPECSRVLNKEHATPEPSPEHVYLESDSDFAARSMLPSTPYVEAMCTPCADDSASDEPSEPHDEFMEYVKVLHERLATNNAAQLRTVCLHCVFVIVALCWPTSLLLSRTLRSQAFNDNPCEQPVLLTSRVLRLLFGAPNTTCYHAAH